MGTERKKIKKVVLIMRHGIRAPNQTPQKLEEWSERKWPKWPVQPGYLTSRGRELIAVFWKKLRQDQLYQNLLFKGSRCIVPEDIFIHADIDERTRSSASAFAAALAPDCKLQYYVTANQKLDPIYHPVKGTICKTSRVEVEDEIIDLVNSTFGGLADQYSKELSFVTKLLGPMPRLTCSEYGVDAGCVLKDLPARVNFANSGRTVNVRGALGIKATLIQNWLLEAAQWPDRKPGWGEISRNELEDLLVVRSELFNCLNRADGYSRDRGSAILKSISDALSGSHEDARVNSARMVAYIGHDTNMAHICDLLGLEWNLETYAYNDIPPGSFLQFLLWEDAHGKASVTAELYAQPLDVLLSSKPENVFPSIIKKELTFAPQNFTSEKAVVEYPLDIFDEVVRSVINWECIPPTEPLTLGSNQLTS